MAIETGSVDVTTLRTNHCETALGIAPVPPVLSWQLRSSFRGARQTAFQIQVGESEEALHAGMPLLWDSGKVVSPAVETRSQVPVLAKARQYWRVRVWDHDDAVSGWSRISWYEFGVADRMIPPARWIESPFPSAAGRSGPVAYFRNVVEVDGPIRSARLWATALGWYQLHVNGMNLTADALVPRFTSFDHRVEYQTYDVGDVLWTGRNVVGLMLADGRFRGALTAQHRRGVYGERTAVSAELEVTYLDGRVQRLTTEKGQGWVVSEGPLRAADPMGGVYYDARRSNERWSELPDVPGWWSDAVIRTDPVPDRIFPAAVPPVCPIAIREAEDVSVDAATRRVLIDFGQNVVGVANVRFSGPRGSEATITYSETLTKEHDRVDVDYVAAGTHTTALPQRDTYVFRGSGTEEFRPEFTIRGFRYVQVDGGSELVVHGASAIVISSDLDYAGEFECSDADLNQLFQNAKWSMIGNFTDVPTDCPTRERSGRTADAQVFAPTATLFADVRTFFGQWLVDLALDQYADGRVTAIVPDAGSRNRPKLARDELFDGAAGFGDAAVLIPWALYQAYGDVDVLAAQYRSMIAWVEFAARRAAGGRHWTKKMRAEKGHEQFLADTGFCPGDPMTPRQRSVTRWVRSLFVPEAEIATAYLAHSSRILAGVAEILGRPEDAGRYHELANNVARAWQAEYLQSNGQIRGGRQSSYVHALAFDLLPAQTRVDAANRLVSMIREQGTHLNTGMLSTGLLLPVLTAGGHGDLAYELLRQPGYPSWLSQVWRGATTMWETWNGSDKAGAARGSLNHTAFGSVVSWMFHTAVGIWRTEPGYRRVWLAPHIGGGLTRASGRVKTPYGPLALSWRIDGNLFTLLAEVPVGITATVRLPAVRSDDVREGDYGAYPVHTEGVHEVSQSGFDTVVEVGSGSYRFTYQVDARPLPVPQQVH